MKLKKEKKKKKLFESASPFQVPYDQYTYSQNFDQGTALDEPDDLSLFEVLGFVRNCNINDAVVTDLRR
ncbi:hypothetical protein D0Y65_019547 [Glycine soja]|uniref:Uncharacterized protein n=1 Tax=Glycine soja TaxID=3848 RepID=A0A445J9L2_GLYSO|nr:hypothetical protein D0Y65_019547 [Glycine soja]